MSSRCLPGMRSVARMDRDGNEDPERDESKRQRLLGAATAIGVGLGAAVFAGTGEAVWVAIGAALGVVIGAAIGYRER